MNHVTFYKIGCGVLLGLIAPLSTVSAAEDVNDYIQSRIGGDGVPLAYESPSWSVGQGAQGPIRNDFMVDHGALDQSYGYAEDAAADRFGYAEDAPALSASSIGANGP